jgi:hypothetical protein
VTVESPWSQALPLTSRETLSQSLPLWAYFPICKMELTMVGLPVEDHVVDLRWEGHQARHKVHESEVSTEHLLSCGHGFGFATLTQETSASCLL